MKPKEQNQRPALSEHDMFLYLIWGRLFQECAKQNTCNDQYNTTAKTGG